MNPDSTVESVQGRILAGLEPVHKHWEYFLASGIAVSTTPASVSGVVLLIRHDRKTA